MGSKNTKCKWDQYKSQKHCCKTTCFTFINQVDNMQQVHGEWSWILTAKHIQQIEDAFDDMDIVSEISSYLPNIHNVANLNPSPFDLISNYHIYISNLNNIPLCQSMIDNLQTFMYRLETYPTLEIMLIGAGGVGKSSLCTRLTLNTFYEELDPTLFQQYSIIYNLTEKSFELIQPQEMDALYKVDLNEKYVDIKNKWPLNKNKIILRLHDSAGGEEFAKPWQYAFDNCKLFLFCFSMDGFGFTMDRVHPPKYRIKLCENNPSIFVGCKGDIVSRSSEYSFERVKQEIFDKYNMPYFETSAKTGHNVQTLFKQCIYEYWYQKYHHY